MAKRLTITREVGGEGERKIIDWVQKVWEAFQLKPSYHISILQMRRNAYLETWHKSLEKGLLPPDQEG